MVPETSRPLRVAFARIALIFLTVVTLPACGTLYVAQAARGQWQVMRARTPINEVIASDQTAPGLRDRLTEVRAARDFASSELGLPDNGSYRSYADLNRPYVVWNVVAAPEFSVSPQRWCFPIAGCVAYRGYFKERSARKFAESLQEKGFDTYVGGVAAYSTLGKFKDPVLNTMLGYGDDELAAIIFHELAHQLIYVANDSEFNEAFATTVEQAGLERWLKLRGREADLGRFTAKRERQAQIIALFIGARTKLAALYKTKLAPDAMRARKREIFDRLDEQIADLEKRLGIRTSYRKTEKGLNNAYLASIATYYDCVPGFERLLESKSGDLPRFYDAVRELTKKSREQRHELLCQTPPSVTQPSVTQPSITGTPVHEQTSDDSGSAGSAWSGH